MADAKADAADGGKKKVAGKKLVLFIVLPLLLLLVGGAGAYFLLAGGDEHAAAAEDGAGGHGDGVGQADSGGHGGGAGGGAGGGKQITFVDLPEILVNLNGGGKQANYLKVNVALEVDSAESVKTINTVLPRVVDSFNVYLRELRLEDLSGSAGLVRLKEELLVRINASLGGPMVKDVLFKEMLVQ